MKRKSQARAQKPNPKPTPAVRPTATRISKDEYYLGIAREVSRRSTCFRRSIGAIIVRDDQIISTGYVGAPRKTRDSLEHGFCLRDRLNIPHGQRYELCRSVHAEQNAIINAARAGVSLLGGDMFIYGRDPGSGQEIDAFPCFICKKMIINAGLNRVVCSTSAGGLQVFLVEDWIRDWQKTDILDDTHQYGKTYENYMPAKKRK
ncbi:MAG: dCMP deaminase family protein [Candidatus Saccharicenans sp.]|jgi:dCMP deaminase|nr:dCMP deaminase family protein [Candidatus Saccharicenans sp.]MDH7493937.1 dCMP deaminase family protein [Candidatus Saccharicenans sp.]